MRNSSGFTLSLIPDRGGTRSIGGVRFWCFRWRRDNFGRHTSLTGVLVGIRRRRHRDIFNRDRRSALFSTQGWRSGGGVVAGLTGGGHRPTAMDLALPELLRPRDGAISGHARRSARNAPSGRRTGPVFGPVIHDPLAHGRPATGYHCGGHGRVGPAHQRWRGTCSWSRARRCPPRSSFPGRVWSCTERRGLRREVRGNPWDGGTRPADCGGCVHTGRTTSSTVSGPWCSVGVWPIQEHEPGHRDESPGPVGPGRLSPSPPGLSPRLGRIRAERSVRAQRYVRGRA